MNIRRMARRVGAIWLALGIAAAGLVGGGGGSALAQGGALTLAQPAATLYDQTNNQGGNYVDSSDWVGHLSTISSQAADDFVIPNDHIWKVISATVPGSIVGVSGTGVTDVIIRFYTNSPSSLPDKLISEQTINTSSSNIDHGALAAGNLVITLTTALTLGPGHYWFSAQARESCSATDGSCKHWSWTERTVKSNAESAWQSPGGSYGPICITWKPRVTACHQPSGSVNPDLLFKLQGTLIPVAAHILLPQTFR